MKITVVPSQVNAELLYDTNFCLRSNQIFFTNHSSKILNCYTYACLLHSKCSNIELKMIRERYTHKYSKSGYRRKLKSLVDVPETMDKSDN